MKDPYEVLRFKEQEITRVQKEIEAPKVAARLLSSEQEEQDNGDRRRVAEMP